MQRIFPVQQTNHTQFCNPDITQSLLVIPIAVKILLRFMFWFHQCFIECNDLSMVIHRRKSCFFNTAKSIEHLLCKSRSVWCHADCIFKLCIGYTCAGSIHHHLHTPCSFYFTEWKFSHVQSCSSKLSMVTERKPDSGSYITNSFHQSNRNIHHWGDWPEWLFFFWYTRCQ